jgi:hypothetical protein
MKPRIKIAIIAVIVTALIAVAVLAVYACLNYGFFYTPLIF